MWCRLTRNRFITDINFALRYFPLAVITEIDLAPYGNEDRFIPFDRLFLSTEYLFFPKQLRAFVFFFFFFYSLWKIFIKFFSNNGLNCKYNK